MSTSRTRRRGLVATLVSLMLTIASLSGCEKTFEDMYDQPKYKPLAASTLWIDGRSSRSPVAGSIPRSEGAQAGPSSGRLGVAIPGPDVPRPLPTIVANAAALGDSDIAKRDSWTLSLLERGRARYDIYCAPCHSQVGDGDGMIVRRGFPRPPSFHSERLRNASDEHLYAVITHGYGVMYSYAGRVPPDDRRAIVAYIRALQLSQNATLDELSAEARASLGGTP